MIITRDNDTNYEEIVKKHGGRLLVIKPAKTKNELFYGNILFKVGDLVRTNYQWPSTLEQKQGVIIGFSEFEYKGEQIPEIHIETETGEFYKSNPGYFERIDPSWFEMC